MNMALALLKRFWPYGVAALAALLVVAGLYALHAHGVSKGEAIANADWSARWNKRDADDARATAQAQAEQRAIEAQRQQAINEAAQNAQREIDQANADAAAAIAAAGSLRDTIDQTIGRLADSQARFSACVTDSGKAAAQSARVLADVLKRADQRAGILAATADQARARGLACEAAYDGLDSK